MERERSLEDKRKARGSKDRRILVKSEYVAESHVDYTSVRSTWGRPKDVNEVSMRDKVRSNVTVV